MYDLTDRQIQILKKLIEEYTATADPVGSSALEKKYDLGISPATIRNEMSDLDNKGYLKQPHTSAGRIPTAKAFRLYIKELMKPDELSVAEEVAFKEKVWDSRFEKEKLLRDFARTLAQTTNMLSLAMTPDDLYYAGTGYVLDMPEFYDIDITRNLLMMLDQISYWQKLFAHIGHEHPFNIILGSELKEEVFDPYAFIFARAKIGQKQEVVVGVIGPKRVPYNQIVPKVSYCAKLLEEIAGW